MDTIEVNVGVYVQFPDGRTHDTRRLVSFTGEQLAQYTEYGEYRGCVSEHRGTTQTLYQSEDGRYIVHVKDWSDYPGEPTVTTLTEVRGADLEVGGRFERLGACASMGRALTLDEALATGEPD